MVDDGLLTDPMIRLFEKIAKWIGLSVNAGPVLAALFLEKYRTGSRLSSDEICDSTGYSRANAGLIVSQLEGLGIVDGQRDYDQTGRGRKRVLYTIRGEFTDVFSLGVLAIQDRLDSIFKDITSLENLVDGKGEPVSALLQDMKSSVSARLAEAEQAIEASRAKRS
jgi:DNA-binding transcriptional regulator GbsR (MarR family)